MKLLTLFTLLIPATTSINQVKMVYDHPPSLNTTTVYFGYGSNLWLHQMSIRCPASQYLGVARLNGFKWLINDRGYANVVEVTAGTKSKKPEYNDVVFGLVYTLEPDDEARLDKNEGVPIAYTKENLSCDFWSAGPPSSPESKHGKVDTRDAPTYTRDMLVYIDRKRVAPDEPRKEYVYRMNQGISDAVEMGVPREYVEEVIRRYIPEEKGGRNDVEEFAKGQAAGFRDESGVF
jgi:gamma-glutamylcyclotransferase